MDLVSLSFMRGEVVVVIMALGGCLLVISSMWYRHFLKIRWPDTLLLAIAAEAIATLLTALHGRPMRGPLFSTIERGQPYYQTPFTGTVFLLTFGTVVLLGMGLATKLYRAWLLGRGREQELQGGAAGFRAWLGPVNLVPILFFAGLAWLSMGWPFLVTTLASLALFSVYPLARTILQVERGNMTRVNETSEERRRVLALVEAGKISGEDGAELISALGETAVREEPVVNLFSRGRLLMFVGAGLVLLGFLLPWFVINIGAEMARSMQAVRGAMPAMPAMPGFEIQPEISVPGGAALQVTVRGGDLHYGLGWIILGAALVVATLPLLWPLGQRNQGSQRGASLALAGAGSVVLLYVVAGGLRNANVGLVLAVMGYVLLWAGLLRTYLAGRTVTRMAMA
jgi:hypothetical protein